jgi:hypothetical protein
MMPSWKGDDRTLERFPVARVGDRGRDRLQTFDALQQAGVALVLVVDADLGHVHFLQARDFFRRGQHFGRAAHDLQAFLVGAHAVENDMLVVVEFLFGGDGDGDRVADGDRRAKCKVWSTRMVPGPGNWVPRTVEISEPLHMPCAITSRNMPLSE